MYKIDYQTEGRNEYILISTDEELSEYQIKMLQINNDGTLVDMQVRGVDDKSVVYYDITGYESIRDRYTYKSKLKFAQFIKLIATIVDIIAKTPRLLLDPNNLLLQSEYIFEGEEDIKLIYLPFKYDFDINYQLRELILSLLLKNVALKSDNRVNIFLDYLQDKEEVIDISDIQRFLKEINTTHQIVKTEDIESKEKKRSKADGVKKDMGKFLSKKYKWLGFALFQLILMGIVSLAYFSLRSRLYENMLLVALLCFVLISDFIFIEKVIKKEPLKEPSVENKVIKQKSPKKSRDDNSPRFKEQKKAEEDNDIPQAIYEYNTQLLQTETVLLPNMSKSLIVLQSKEEGYGDIIVGSNEFIIGRHPEKVNYNHKSRAVGRRHLMVFNGLAKDLGSVNGSFLNGERMCTSEEYQLEDGDDLRLADVEYRIFIDKDMG